MTQLGSEIALLPVDEEEAPRAGIVVLTTAELAECTCPEFCERDHDVD
jgi:hypothetical protein